MSGPTIAKKMLQGVYRGYAGDAAEAPAKLFVTPQKRVADYYATKRAEQTGGLPHVEMLLIDPVSGVPYGHSTLGSGSVPPMYTRARSIAPDDVRGRTKLYADGGSIRPTERSGGLGMVADALRATRDFANKAQLPWELGGVGDILLGKTPEEVDDWSYGNSPFDRGYAGIGDRLPRIKPKRREQVFDTALTLPGLIPAKTAVRGAKYAGREGLRALDNAMLTGEGPLATLAGAARPMSAVRPRGGNVNQRSLDRAINGLVGVPMRGRVDTKPHEQWADKQLRNYLARDLGAPTDPLLALEKEMPGLHIGDEPDRWPTSNEEIRELYGHRDNAREGYRHEPLAAAAENYLDHHDKLTGGAPLTRWGRAADSVVTSVPAKIDFASEWVQKWPRSSLAPDRPYRDEPNPIGRLLRHTDNILNRVPADTSGPFAKKIAEHRDAKVAEYRDELGKALETDWRMKKPDEDVYSIHNLDGLGFDHVLDYLEAATDPYTRIRRNFDPKDHGDAYNRFMNEGFDAFDSVHPYRREDIDRWRALHNAGLTLDPASLSRLSVADAVKKTAQWNEFLAAQRTADGPLSKGWRVHKEYGPEHGGMKWVEFTKPDNRFTADTLPEGYQLKEVRPGRFVVTNSENASDLATAGSAADALDDFNRYHKTPELRDGLRAEGDAMGHCVGGYCDDVLTRGTKIYSLRDAKGQPHVTIEVTPGAQPHELARDEVLKYFDANGDGREATYRHAEFTNFADKLSGGDPYVEFAKLKGFKIPETPMRIVQIKGKGNGAPKADYLPMVQDFVKSQQWDHVGDLRNTGLVQFRGGATNYRPPVLPGMENHRAPLTLRMPEGYYTPEEVAKFLIDQGAPEDWAHSHVGNFTMRRYKDGGSVERDPPGFLPRTLEDQIRFLEDAYAVADQR